MLLNSYQTTPRVRTTLIDVMGNDLTVVNAARVSFDKHVNIMDEADERLIEYLAKHDHWTPFSHPQITLREEVPIFVARQRFKHMVGFTYNEVSRRYVDDVPEFYCPSEWRGRPDKSVKQGSGEPVANQAFANALYDMTIDTAFETYRDMISDGVAPEMARMVLPQATMTSYYVTGSLAAFARAYVQRSDSHAQKEIRDLAEDWDRLISRRFPVSWRCLTQQKAEA